MRKTMSREREIHLPDECWECVFRLLHHRYLQPLSLVSKQFHSITNRLRFSLTIVDETVPFLPRLFLRFPSLTSLDLTLFRGYLHALLLEISGHQLSCLKSLNLSHHMSIPADALPAFSKKFPTLTSLNCSHMFSIKNSDLLLIADCFPLLEELDISFPKSKDDGVSEFVLLPKLRKVNLAGNSFVNDSFLLSLCKNCGFLQELLICEGQGRHVTQAGIACAIRERPCLRSFSASGVASMTSFVTSDFIGSLVSLKTLTCLVFCSSFISDDLLCSVANEGLPLRKLGLNYCYNYSYHGIFSLLSKCQFIQHLDLEAAGFLNDNHVAELSVFLSNLVTINVTYCRKLTNSAFFALARNCPLLSEIKMLYTKIGKKSIKKDSLVDCSIVNPQVKSLYLSNNKWLTDESVTMFASICPNLELLDLSFCKHIYEGVVQVLRRCCKIRHLSLVACPNVKLYGLDFEVPSLEVLNLSMSRITNEELSVISKCCPGLLDMDLLNCYSEFTTQGVREVVEKCTKLRHKFGDLL